jgi:integrase
LAALVRGFEGAALYPIVAVAAFTGARIREILALRWSDLSVENKTLTITRAIDETKAHGRGTKGPKTARGFRTIAIDDSLIDLLMSEREKHRRLVAGVPDRTTVNLSLVRLPDGALMFPGGDGTKPTKLRDARAVSRNFKTRARRLGFKLRSRIGSCRQYQPARRKRNRQRRFNERTGAETVAIAPRVDTQCFQVRRSLG